MPSEFIWPPDLTLLLTFITPLCFVAGLLVLVVCVPVVVWFVVPLGLIVTVLFGIALKVASVFTVVLALRVIV